eukprot:c53559_g1_i1 orf=343-633(+)
MRSHSLCSVEATLEMKWCRMPRIPTQKPNSAEVAIKDNWDVCFKCLMLSHVQAWSTSAEIHVRKENSKRSPEIITKNARISIITKFAPCCRERERE